MALAIAPEYDLDSRQSRHWFKVVGICRNWLRWQNPETKHGMIISIDGLEVTGPYGVPSSRWDKEGRSTAEATLGPYRIALHNAQLHHAALWLPPMMRIAAFAARQHKDAGSIIGKIVSNNRSEWLRWQYNYPIHPLKALLAATAVEMAEKIERDLA